MLNEQPHYIKNHIINFMDAFKKLKTNSYIDSNISWENFKAIFGAREIPPGSNKELQWFVKYLVYTSQKVVDLDKDIWLITIKCFINKNDKEFTESQLRNVSVDRLDREELVESILSKC